LLPPDRLQQALNALLPGDVAVRHVLDVAPDFHARRDARLRVYRYVVLSRPEPPALLRRYVHHVPGPLDLAAMRDAAALLRGRRDFAAFRAAGTPTATTVCDVRALGIEPRGRLVIFTVAADRFLRQMVRRLVGTLLAVGAGALPPQAAADILDARAGARGVPPVPACGLYLVGVRYAPGRMPEPQGPGRPGPVL
jgi:tRNA pseudouridine38-40 synthase